MEAKKKRPDRYKNIKSSERQLDKPLDWAKFTDFRSQNSREDLERLCSGMDVSRVKKMLETADEAGLCPIHWASIHNRSDMLKFMIEKANISLDLRCRNKLFANGTALHLAAMNGSLEVAALILDDQSGKPKRDENNNNQKDGPRQKKSLLSLRDSEGQTPLMRSAAPRSKRMNTVWDLLRKNLWSLSGRPSEMALFLIYHGADWRQTEPTNGMNLMHLAIMNDYDDIVNLLLVIDKELLDMPVRPPNHTNPESRQIKTIKAPEEEQTQPKRIISPEFETINLKDDTSSVSSASTTTTTSTSSPTQKALIDDEEKAEQLMAKGLDPLQLAILYGRVAIIGLLWHAKFQREQASKESKTSLEIQRTALREHRRSSKELKQILIRACWNNKEELARFIKVGLLKGLLAIDLALLALVWAPAYSLDDDYDNDGQVTTSTLRGGVFVFSYCVSMAMAFRVMLRNPGYLRRNSIQYLKEMSKLIGKKTTGAEESNQSAQSESKPSAKSSSGLNGQQLSLNLIKLDENQAEQEQSSMKSSSQTVPPAGKAQVVVSELPNWQEQFTDAKDKVRLLCHKCRCIRRPRSKHCNYCNHCVQDYDHHCIYLGCCIGRNNRLDFLLTMVSLSITSIYGSLVFSLTGRRGFWHSVGLIWILKYVIVGVLTSFFNLLRACQGVTLFESIRSRRIRSIFGAGGPPEAISKSHRAYSILKGSYWRYEPDRYLTGELPARKILANLDDFGGSISLDEYLLTLICTDTSLARALTSSDSRINKYRFAA